MLAELPTPKSSLSFWLGLRTKIPIYTTVFCRFLGNQNKIKGIRKRIACFSMLRSSSWSLALLLRSEAIIAEGFTFPFCAETPWKSIKWKLRSMEKTVIEGITFRFHFRGKSPKFLISSSAYKSLHYYAFFCTSSLSLSTPLTNHIMARVLNIF